MRNWHYVLYTLCAALAVATFYLLRSVVVFAEIVAARGAACR